MQSWGGFVGGKKKGNRCKRHNSSRRTRAIPLVTAVAGLTVSLLMTVMLRRGEERVKKRREKV